MVVVGDIPNDTFGWKRKGMFDGTKITLSTWLVKEYENDRARKYNIPEIGMVYEIEATLLHELVHWGDSFRLGKSPYREVGDEFEQLAYGRNL